jgi:acid phosphatase type 7
MRFKMPKSPDNSYYTFKIGSAIFIGISTEVYYEDEINDFDSSIKQREWLEYVLYNANLPENRARNPWIIVYGHRPLYCSSASDCVEGVTLYPKVKGTF